MVLLRGFASQALARAAIRSTRALPATTASSSSTPSSSDRWRLWKAAQQKLKSRGQACPKLLELPKLLPENQDTATLEPQPKWAVSKTAKSGLKPKGKGKGKKGKKKMPKGDGKGGYGKRGKGKQDPNTYPTNPRGESGKDNMKGTPDDFGPEPIKGWDWLDWQDSPEGHPNQQGHTPKYPSADLRHATGWDSAGGGKWTQKQSPDSGGKSRASSSKSWNTGSGSGSGAKQSPTGSGGKKGKGAWRDTPQWSPPEGNPMPAGWSECTLVEYEYKTGQPYVLCQKVDCPGEADGSYSFTKVGDLFRHPKCKVCGDTYPLGGVFLNPDTGERLRTGPDWAPLIKSGDIINIKEGDENPDKIRQDKHLAEKDKKLQENTQKKAQQALEMSYSSTGTGAGQGGKGKDVATFGGPSTTNPIGMGPGLFLPPGMDKKAFNVTADQDFLTNESNIKCQAQAPTLTEGLAKHIAPPPALSQEQYALLGCGSHNKMVVQSLLQHGNLLGEGFDKLPQSNIDGMMSVWVEAGRKIHQEKIGVGVNIQPKSLEESAAIVSKCLGDVADSTVQAAKWGHRVANLEKQMQMATKIFLKWGEVMDQADNRLEQAIHQQGELLAETRAAQAKSQDKELESKINKIASQAELDEQLKGNLQASQEELSKRRQDVNALGKELDSLAQKRAKLQVKTVKTEEGNDKKDTLADVTMGQGEDAHGVNDAGNPTSVTVPLQEK